MISNGNNQNRMDEGLPLPLLLSPAPARHSWSSSSSTSSASPISMATSLARHNSPRKRLFHEGPASSSPPPSPVPIEKSPFRRSLFGGVVRGGHHFDHDGTWPARQINGRSWSAGGPPAKRLRLDIDDPDAFLPPRPLRLGTPSPNLKALHPSPDLWLYTKCSLFSPRTQAARPAERKVAWRRCCWSGPSRTSSRRTATLRPRAAPPRPMLSPRWTKLTTIGTTRALLRSFCVFSAVSYVLTMVMRASW
jgi:hypothetical protein